MGFGNALNANNPGVVAIKTTGVTFAAGYSTTPFTVGAVNVGTYQTIQAAVNAAHAAGGGQVFIQPGTYTENLTLFTGIQLSSPSEQSVTIIGTHTPPSTGTLNIDRLTLQGTNAIFSSSAAGTTVIIIEDCTVNVLNGYTFDLVNWTGQIQAFDIGSAGTADGFIHNTGGATVNIYAAGIGNGTSNPMILSGDTSLGPGNSFFCPIHFVTGAKVISTTNQYSETLTFLNDSLGAFYNDSLVTDTSAAITQSSTGTIDLSSVVINTSNNPSISGAGSGVITLTGVSFYNNTAVSGSLNVSGGAGFVASSLVAYAPVCGGTTASGPLQSVASVGTSGQFLISNGAASLSSFQTFPVSLPLNFTFTTSSASPGVLTVANTNNASTGAHSVLSLTVGSTSGGNPYISLGGSGVTAWTLGNNNTASPGSSSFVISASSTLGTSVAFSISSTGVPSFPAAPLGVASGGTGDASLTAYSVICGGTTSTSPMQPLASLGTSGQVLTSNGAGALPSFQNLVSSSQVKIQVITTTGTYTPTPGMDYCIIEVVGGGGGGGGVHSDNSQQAGGGGGGAGGYSRRVLSAAQIGSSQTVTIGAGGPGGIGAVNGTDGNTTSVGVLISASGGGGGFLGSGGKSSSALGSSGGIGSSGDINIQGGWGDSAIGAFSNDGTVVVALSGGGGTSYFGGGGGSVADTGGQLNGNPGASYGSGGSGAVASGGSATGGAGKIGIVMITEFI